MCIPLYFDVIHYGLNPYMKKDTISNNKNSIILKNIQYKYQIN